MQIMQICSFVCLTMAQQRNSAAAVSGRSAAWPPRRFFPVENFILVKFILVAGAYSLLKTARMLMALQTLEISGKIKPLMGQNTRGKPAPLALFALCCPFGPLPLPDVPWRDYTFKTRHSMDLTLLSMDSRYIRRLTLLYLTRISSVK